MGYFLEWQITEAKDALVHGSHPSIVPLLAVCLDSLSGSERSISKAEEQVLDETFFFPGSEDLQWYVPLGKARGASSESGRWRGKKANYVGRSLQRMAKELRNKGVYSVEDNKKALSLDANNILPVHLEKTPGLTIPMPVWPWAIWHYRHEDMASLPEAIEKFWHKFGLDRLPSVFTKNDVPADLMEAALSESMVDSYDLIDKLEPRPDETTSEGLPLSALEEERHGVDSILGVKLNEEGDEKNGGRPVQLLLHGGPGSGKSYRLNEYSRSSHYTFRTVIHPETRYNDFVGGLRPITIWKKESPAPTFFGLQGPSLGDPRVIYQFSPGPFLQAYYLACFEPRRSVSIIVEELSRGNPAQIFGDILQLLDRLDEATDDLPAGASQYSIDPRPDVRAWLVENDIVAYESVDPVGKMRLPNNLFIWSTMNRADQNARQLDAAFLRRWAREHCSWKQKDGKWDEIVIRYGGEGHSWAKLRSHINNRLVSLGGVPEDKLIGPYFIPKSRLLDAQYLFEDIWGYLWHEVLKSRAPDFFSVDTLADLEDLWDNGKGAPLSELD